MDVYELRKYLLKTLNPDNISFEDGNANDLQIDCENKEIKKITLGVSASLKLFEESKKVGADVIITHHGLGLREKYISNSILNKPLQKRLRFLYQNNMSLFGFHFLLDWHPELGHNVQTLKKLGLKNFKPFGKHKSNNWGWMAEFEEEIDVNDIFDELNKIYLGNAQMCNFKNQKIKTIGVVAGGGGSIIHEAGEEGIDLMVTGEIYEGVEELAREYGVNLIWGGHYISERLGMIALAKKIEKDLGIECEFIEIMSKT